jgi:hypothetical protein
VGTENHPIKILNIETCQENSNFIQKSEAFYLNNLPIYQITAGLNYINWMHRQYVME